VTQFAETNTYRFHHLTEDNDLATLTGDCYGYDMGMSGFLRMEWMVQNAGQKPSTEFEAVSAGEGLWNFRTINSWDET